MSSDKIIKAKQKRRDESYESLNKIKDRDGSLKGKPRAFDQILDDITKPAFRGREFQQEATEIVDDVSAVSNMTDQELNHHKVKAQQEIKRLQPTALHKTLKKQGPLGGAIASFFEQTGNGQLGPVKELLELINIEQDRRERESRQVDHRPTKTERINQAEQNLRTAETLQVGELTMYLSGRSYDQLSDDQKAEYEQIDKDHDAKIQAIREKIGNMN